MALGYLISPAFQCENAEGKPLVGGFLHVFRSGTTNPARTYRNFDGDLNPNDIVLNNKGMAIIICDDSAAYDVYCYDSNGVEQWSRVHVCVIGSDVVSPANVDITSSDHSIAITKTTDLQSGDVEFDIRVDNVPDKQVELVRATSKEQTFDGTNDVHFTGYTWTMHREYGDKIEVLGHEADEYKAIVMNPGVYHVEYRVRARWEGPVVNKTGTICGEFVDYSHAFDITMNLFPNVVTCPGHLTLDLIVLAVDIVAPAGLKLSARIDLQWIGPVPEEE